MDYSLQTEFNEHLKQEWNDLLEHSSAHVPFLRYEYLLAWWQTRGGGEWPAAELALVTARQDGVLVGIAPLFKAEHDGRSALMLVGSIEISDYLDLIARPGDLQEFCDGLVPFLRVALKGWQALDFYNLLDDSLSLAVLARTSEALGMSYHAETLQHAPFISLPGDFDLYLESIDKKQRHEIRRKMRRAEEADLPVRWYIAADPAAIDAEIEAFMSLMAQDPEKDKFLTPAMREHMRLTCRCAFDAGCLQLAFLTVNGEKACGYLSFDYLERIWVYNSGLDRRFMEYSPGWVLLGYLLKWANENGRTEFDFMRGDEEYKYRFGAVDRTVLRVLMN